MMKSKWMILLLLVLDLSIIVMEWRVFSEEWKHNGAWMLRFYTNSSNVLAMFVCMICAVCEIACLVRGCALPGWTQLLRYVSACCLMVTMIVAACILVPTDPTATFKSFMLRGDLLYTHTLCPLVMLAGCMIHGGVRLTAAHAALAVVPTIVYGVITLIMNAKKIYTGPYFFFRIDRQPWHTTVMWMAVIVVGNFVVSWLLGKLQGLIHRIG